MYKLNQRTYKYISLYTINVKTFTSTRVCRTDDADIFEKINKLLDKNKSLFYESKKDLFDKNQLEKVKKEHEEYQDKHASMVAKVQVQSRLGDPYLNESEQEKILKNNTTLTPKQKEALDKLEGLDKDDPASLLEVLKIENIFNKISLKKLEKTEKIVTAAFEREEKAGNISNNESLTYWLLKGRLLKDRLDFKKEESEYFTKHEKGFASLIKAKGDESSVSTDKPSGTSSEPSDGLTGSSSSSAGPSARSGKASKESPMEYVSGLLETEMPSYTDPED